MQEVMNIILRFIIATLFLYLINALFMLEIPFDFVYLTIIAVFGIPGLFLVLFILYF